ncbi:DMT family transporter [Minwuia sp.]|uniref:DMT family transporter n=1 Tax=Minwuia sp. TaxID=2493630 RepID=UPI003A8E798C
MLGLVTASIWAGYIVIVRYGMTSDYRPLDMAVARYWPAGLILLPVLLKVGVRDLGGVGWARGIMLTLFAGPAFALLLSSGLRLTTVSHGGVIAPATLTLMTTLLSILFLKERLSAARTVGLLLIGSGLILIAGAAFLVTFNRDVLIGDLLVVAAPSCWAVFTVLLRVWQIDAVRGTAVVSVLGALALVPFHVATTDYGDLIAVHGWADIGMQFFGQGVLNGFLATLLFLITVSRIGPARAAVFPSLVPALSILIGAPLLGEQPDLSQIAGMAVVTFGLFLAVGLYDDWRGKRLAAQAG